MTTQTTAPCAYGCETHADADSRCHVCNSADALYIVTIGDHTIRLQVGPGSPLEAPLVARAARLTAGGWALQQPGSPDGHAATQELAVSWITLLSLTASTERAIRLHNERAATFGRPAYGVAS